MFLKFGKKITDEDLLYSGQVGNDICIWCKIKNALLLQIGVEIVWDNVDWMNGLINVGTCIWYPPQILKGRMTSSPTCLILNILFSQSVVQPMMVVIAVLCVPWMLLVKPLYLRHKYKAAEQEVSWLKCLHCRGVAWYGYYSWTCIKQSPSIKRSVVKVPKIMSLYYCNFDLYKWSPLLSGRGHPLLSPNELFLLSWAVLNGHFGKENHSNSVTGNWISNDL